MLVVIDFQVILFVIEFRPISPIKSMILPLFIKVVHIVRNITTASSKQNNYSKLTKLLSATAIHLCAALRMRVTFDLVNTSLLKMYRADLVIIIKLIIAENLVSFDFVE